MIAERIRAAYLRIVSRKQDDRALARLAAAEERALAERDAADMDVGEWAFAADLPERSTK